MKAGGWGPARAEITLQLRAQDRERQARGPRDADLLSAHEQTAAAADALTPAGQLQTWLDQEEAHEQQGRRGVETLQIVSSVSGGGEELPSYDEEHWGTGYTDDYDR